MPNIEPTNNLNIQDELTNLELYKYHPNGILNVSLNRLTDMLSGKVEIIDPNNPFVYLLETNCLNTAFAIQENLLLTRKLYPRLANTEDDLYLHMSDKDYLGRFGEPAFANVLFNILFNDFNNKATYNPILKEYVLKIPRHLKLTVDQYIFTLPSAIIIRKSDNGVIDVKYENQTFNNIFPVTTNFISFDIFKINQDETYLTFSVRMPEVDIETVELPVEKSKLFRNRITYNPNRLFYYFRAFYLLDGDWKEMIVTHTDQVYDIYTPTCIVKILGEINSVEYYIPPVYVNTGKLGTRVKFLVYTTNGSINVNFNDYKVPEFLSEYNPVFPDQEIDEFTQPLQLISKVIYIRDEVIDGKNSISFIDLKDNVIDNSIGDRKLPITNKQLEFEVLQRNFKLLKSVDNLNTRIFLLESNIPTAKTRYPISRFNLDIIEYKTKISDLISDKNSIVVIDNGNVIIPQGTVFKIDSGEINILDSNEYSVLVSRSGIELTTLVNTNKYISVFYHYVLDTSGNELELRPYEINSPNIDRISFKEFNATNGLSINTISSNIYKSSNGFTIDVITSVKRYNNSIDETNVTPYIVYRANDITDSKFFLKGRLYTTVNDNPVFRFDIDTQYYIDKDHKLYITNFIDGNGDTITVPIDLLSKLEVIWLTDTILPTFESTSIDEYVLGTQLAVNNVVLTLEEYTVRFGWWLKLLYSRTHTSVTEGLYEVYEDDVPKKYKSTVYGVDNSIIHMVGDVVLDENNEIVYEALKGDVKLDEFGNPIETRVEELSRYLNLCFIDYIVGIPNLSTIKDYRTQLRQYLTEKIVENAPIIQENLLDNSEAFVVVPKNLNDIEVKTPTRTIRVNSRQDFVVNVFVNDRVYNELETRDNIVFTIIKELDEYLYNNTLVSKTEALNSIYNRIKEFVSSVSIERFTELNEEYMEIVNSNARLSFDKTLVIEGSDYNIVDDIVVNFIKV